MTKPRSDSDPLEPIFRELQANIQANLKKLETYLNTHGYQHGDAYTRLANPARPCAGCAHSASGFPWPGIPSGETMCMSCIRNPQREEWVEQMGQRLRNSGRTPDETTESLARFQNPKDLYYTLGARDVLSGRVRQSVEREYLPYKQLIDLVRREYQPQDIPLPSPVAEAGRADAGDSHEPDA
jgi:hypothetical protein